MTKTDVKRTMASSKAILEKLSFVMKQLIERNGFNVFLKNVSVSSVAPGKVNFEMKVQKEHTNQANTMHGGLTSSLVDALTTLALMTTENGTPGVSVNLAVSYFKGKLPESVTNLQLRPRC